MLLGICAYLFCTDEALRSMVKWLIQSPGSYVRVNKFMRCNYSARYIVKGVDRCMALMIDFRGRPRLEIDGKEEDIGKLNDAFLVYLSSPGVTDKKSYENIIKPNTLYPKQKYGMWFEKP